MSEELKRCEHDFRVLTRKDVILATKIVVAAGMMPVRVVLRHLGKTWDDKGDEYVVHTEVLQADPERSKEENLSIAFKHFAFETGDYFTDQRAARRRFEERRDKL